MDCIQTPGQSRPPDSASRKGCLGFIGSAIFRIRTSLAALFRGLLTLDYQYESRSRILGWPLLAVNLGFRKEEEKVRHAKGLVAIGTRATGLFSLGFLEARGVFTVGTISLGIGAVGVWGIGVVTVSVVGLGVVSVSLFALGYLAIGILAVGWRSVGILAFGREAVGIIAFGRAIQSLFPF